MPAESLVGRPVVLTVNLHPKRQRSPTAVDKQQPLASVPCLSPVESSAQIH